MENQRQLHLDARAQRLQAREAKHQQRLQYQRDYYHREVQGKLARLYRPFTLSTNEIVGAPPLTLAVLSGAPQQFLPRLVEIMGEPEILNESQDTLSMGAVEHIIRAKVHRFNDNMVREFERHPEILDDPNTRSVDLLARFPPGENDAEDAFAWVEFKLHARHTYTPRKLRAKIDRHIRQWNREGENNSGEAIQGDVDIIELDQDDEEDNQLNMDMAEEEEEFDWQQLRGTRYEILQFQDVGRMKDARFSEMEAHGPGGYLGYHNFGLQSAVTLLERKYSVGGPLRLKTFPCLYESLCMIEWCVARDAATLREARLP